MEGFPSDVETVEIPAAGDPFAAFPGELPPGATGVHTFLSRGRGKAAEHRYLSREDFAAARRTFHAEMNTGPDPYADPARWIGCTDSEADERRSE